MAAASFIAALTGAKVKKGYAFTGTIDLWLVEATPITTSTFILLLDSITTTSLDLSFRSATIITTTTTTTTTTTNR